jgi:hypothetical protein
MTKSQKITLISITLALAQMMCFSARAQSTQFPVSEFPSDGTANSFMSAAPQTEKNTAKQTQDLAISYIHYLQKMYQLSPIQALGIVGNLMYASGGEAGLNSGWQQTQSGGTIGPASMDGNVSNYSGSGIAQWQDSRKQGLINFALHGKLECVSNNEKVKLENLAKPDSPTSSQVANFGFLLHELTCVPQYASVITKLKAETTILGAVCLFENLYEQPLKNIASAQRLQLANKAAVWLGEKPEAEPASDVCTKPGGAGPGSGGGSGSGPSGGNVNIPVGASEDGTFTNNANGYGQLSQYSPFIIAASQATGVPVDLIAAVIWDESSGNANVGCTHEPGGNLFDCGLMQVTSAPGSFVATDPAANIMHGTQMLAGAYRGVIEQYGSPEAIMNKYHVSAWDLALRVYNSGSVDPNNINNGFLATSEYVSNIHKFANQLHNSGHLSW